ncbi:MAG TPA: hypothetical protein P5089_00180 [Candidatus Portnoybacteria bacterium]|nr:hypothetical protein [Candidatus Portnoybacteria bacterium]
MICKFCLQDKKLVDAHIVPRCFFERQKGGELFLEVLCTNKSIRKSRSYIGLYDNSLVCYECEQKFSKFDDYGCKLLLSNLDDKNFILSSAGEKAGYQINSFDYDKLKLFFLSVLWRASNSERKEFAKINVGSYNEKLKEMIINKNPGNQDEFSIFLTKFIDPLGSRNFMDPFSIKIDGINMCVFYFGGGYKAYIKVDKRPLSNLFNLFIIKKDRPAVVFIEKNFIESKEFQVAKLLFK